MSDNVRVAVRVRPFNQRCVKLLCTAAPSRAAIAYHRSLPLPPRRERDRGAKSIIRIDKTTQSTYIMHPETGARARGSRPRARTPLCVACCHPLWRSRRRGEAVLL